MAFKQNTRHGSYYINVAQVLGVGAAFVIAWRYLKVLEENGSKIEFEINDETVKDVAREVGRTARWIF